MANARFPNERAHGIQIAKTAEAFVQQGVELTLLVPKKGIAHKQNVQEFYGLQKSFPVKYLFAGSVAPKTQFGFLFSSFVFGVSAFIYLLFHNKHDVLYSIDLDPLSFLGFIFLQRQIFFEMHIAKRNSFLYRLLFNRVRGIIAINDAVKRGLLRNFPVLKGKILIGPNGVDIEKYIGVKTANTRKTLNLSQGKKLIIYTGSFQDWKGIETIIEAARELAKYSFYFVGGSEKDIENIDAGTDMPSNVHLIGKRSHKEMPFWHKSADILLVTGTKKNTYSYRETSPMKLFEYMAAKKPIIASKTPAIEYIVSEKQVFFHEPDNPTDLKEVIKEVFQNTALAREKVLNAYQMARHYSWDNRAKKIIRFIRNTT